MTAPLIEITGDGSATLRNALHGDTYHSTRGAVGESRHVFIEAGWQRPQRDKLGSEPVNVLEMGLGTGLNAWLTLLEAERTGRRVVYTAVELHPVPGEIAARLGYTDDPRFEALHDAPWGTPEAAGDAATEIDPRFTIRKLRGDMAAMLENDGLLHNFDLVYWDAFAPETQPELWTERIFARLHGAMAHGGVLVTYSARGDVRRAMQAAGLAVEKLPGALGKRHMLRATKI